MVLRRATVCINGVQTGGFIRTWYINITDVVDIRFPIYISLMLYSMYNSWWIYMDWNICTGMCTKIFWVFSFFFSVYVYLIVVICSSWFQYRKMWYKGQENVISIFDVWQKFLLQETYRIWKLKIIPSIRSQFWMIQTIYLTLQCTPSKIHVEKTLK